MRTIVPGRRIAELEAGEFRIKLLSWQHAPGAFIPYAIETWHGWDLIHREIVEPDGKTDIDARWEQAKADLVTTIAKIAMGLRG